MATTNTTGVANNTTVGPNTNSFNAQNYQQYLAQNGATSVGNVSTAPKTTPLSATSSAPAGVLNQQQAYTPIQGVKATMGEMIGASGQPGSSSSTGSGPAVIQTRAQRAYIQQLQAYQTAMAQQAVRDAQNGAAVMMPSKQAYTNAMNTAVNTINSGLAQSQAYLGQGLDESRTNMQAALDSLNSNYGLGIKAVGDYGEKGQQSISSYQDAAQQYLGAALASGQNALSPFSNMAPEAAGSYNDFVNQGFDANFAAYQNSPVYQLQLQENQKQLQNSAAARGILQSGQTNKDLVKYSSDYAAQQYNAYQQQQYQQQYDRAQMALGAANSYANLGATIAPQQAQTAMQAGLASADLYANVGNTMGNLYGDLGTRNAATYGDFTNINAGLYNAQAQQQAQASAALAQYQKEGILGAGQQVYYTNKFNDTF